MNRDRRSSSQDPTDEPTAAQSTQSASGVARGRGPGVERNERIDAGDRDVVNTEDMTPRRYEQPLDADDDPVMPSDDSTMNTKI